MLLTWLCRVTHSHADRTGRKSTLASLTRTFWMTWRSNWVSLNAVLFYSSLSALCLVAQIAVASQLISLQIPWPKSASFQLLMLTFRLAMAEGQFWCILMFFTDYQVVFLDSRENSHERHEVWLRQHKSFSSRESAVKSNPNVCYSLILTCTPNPAQAALMELPWSEAECLLPSGFIMTCLPVFIASSCSTQGTPEAKPNLLRASEIKNIYGRSKYMLSEIAKWSTADNT